MYEILSPSDSTSCAHPDGRYLKGDVRHDVVSAASRQRIQNTDYVQCFTLVDEEHTLSRSDWSRERSCVHALRRAANDAESCLESIKLVHVRPAHARVDQITGCRYEEKSSEISYLGCALMKPSFVTLSGGIMKSNFNASFGLTILLKLTAAVRR